MTDAPCAMNVLRRSFSSSVQGPLFIPTFASLLFLSPRGADGWAPVT
jgi:hypothetical protein